MENKISYIRKILALPDSKAMSQAEVEELTDAEVLMLTAILGDWRAKVVKENEVRSARRKSERVRQ